MPDNDLCIHEIARCTICEPSIDPEPRGSSLPDSRPFRAAYDAICRSCGFDIRAGQRVCYRRDRLVHAGCADG